MTRYRLLQEYSWAMFLPKLTFVSFFIFSVAGMALFLALKHMEDGFGIFMGGVCWFLALLMLSMYFAGEPIFNRYATLENEVLTIYTRTGKKVKDFSLREMTAIYAWVFYRGHNMMEANYQKSMVLYPNEMILEKQTCSRNGECLQQLNAWMRERNKMVFIVNKELEEKILAYYGEPITEPGIASKGGLIA